MLKNHLWLSRLLIGAVLLVNLQCALAFLRQPQAYMAGFGLAGAAGAGMTRALGLLFVMWNVPYGFACVHPIKYRTSLIETLIMQTIGLLGETLIFITEDFQNPVIRVTVGRFILFDGAGLLLLLLAFALTRAGRVEQI